jgi:hypothetical protein
MSCLAEPRLLRVSRLLEREPYILSYRADPRTPQADASLRVIVDSRDRALQGFFDEGTHVLQQVWRQLQFELALHRCLAGIAGLGIRMPDSNRVRTYLRRHPDLIPPRETIATVARREWLPEDEVTLDLYQDPEVREEYLTLCLRPRHYTANTMGLIAPVADVAGAELIDTSGWVLVTTDLRPPGAV